MYRFFLLYFFIFFVWSKQSSKEQFINNTRARLIQHSWTHIQGNLFFRSKDKELIKKKFALKIYMNFQKLKLKLSFDKKETIFIEQTFGKNYQYKELFNNLAKQNTFTQMNFSVTDLSFSFMYWDLVKEFDNQTVGLYKCRVFLFRDPDQFCFAKVFISKKFFVPLKVQWYKDLQQKAYQQLNFEAFKEKNKVWIPGQILLTTPKGRIKIQAEKYKAGRGKPTNKLFKK